MCYNKKKHALAGKGTSMKKITIITGHYGSGKTNLAVNLALRLADAAIQRLGAQVNPKIVLSVFAAKFRAL